MPPTYGRAYGSTANPRAGYQTAFSAGLSYFPDVAVAMPLGGFVDALAIGANALVPGSGVALQVGAKTGALDKIFHGGAATDAGRQARADWTELAAKNGSPTAAALIVAAPANVGPNEDAMWTRALSRVPADVLQQAYAMFPSGYWPEGQPDFYTDVSGPTHRQIMSEVGQYNQVAGAVGGAVQGGLESIMSAIGLGPKPMPAVVTPNGTVVTPATRGASVSPLLLGGLALVGGALLFAGKRRRR